MSIFWRAFYACVLVLATILWTKALLMYPGLLGKSNVVSLLAALTLLGLWLYGFKTTERQTFWKTMMVLLTLLSLGLFTWFMSALTVILGGLVGISLLALGVLYEDSLGDRLVEIVGRAAYNKQLRKERASARHATDVAMNEQGLSIFENSPA